MAHQVVVIGAGIIGACTALALAEDGCKVTLVEPEEPGGPQAASYGNGTWISPGSIIPVATPGLWRKLPALLADPSGPLVVRWKALPSHLFFLAGFLAAGSTRKRMAMIAEALAGLLAGAPAQYEMLAVKVGRVDLIKRNGLLHTFSDRAAFEAEASFWRLRREHGIRWIALDDDALRACEPQTLRAISLRGARGRWGAVCRSRRVCCSDSGDGEAVRCRTTEGTRPRFRFHAGWSCRCSHA